MSDDEITKLRQENKRLREDLMFFLSTTETLLAGIIDLYRKVRAEQVERQNTNQEQ